LPTAAVERAIAMSHDKYCSATIMLAKTAKITTSFELIERLTGPSSFRCDARWWSSPWPPRASPSAPARAEA
jgi:hypothetical protein